MALRDLCQYPSKSYVSTSRKLGRDCVGRAQENRYAGPASVLDIAWGARSMIGILVPASVPDIA
eukprot:1242013-Rhodomonas_salina.1